MRYVDIIKIYLIVESFKGSYVKGLRAHPLAAQLATHPLSLEAEGSVKYTKAYASKAAKKASLYSMRCHACRTYAKKDVKSVIEFFFAPREFLY